MTDQQMNEDRFRDHAIRLKILEQRLGELAFQTGQAWGVNVKREGDLAVEIGRLRADVEHLTTQVSILNDDCDKFEQRIAWLEDWQREEQGA